MTVNTTETDGPIRAMAQEWQPMSTAPRDGWPVLLAITNDPPAWVVQGYWDREAGRWYERNTYGDCVYLEPSHWQPLPSPPAPLPVPAQGG